MSISAACHSEAFVAKRAHATGSWSRSPPAPRSQPQSCSFATHAASARTAPGGRPSGGLPGDGPQLLSAPEAGAFLVSHPLRDGASTLTHPMCAEAHSTGRCCALQDDAALKRPDTASAGAARSHVPSCPLHTVVLTCLTSCAKPSDMVSKLRAVAALQGHSREPSCCFVATACQEARMGWSSTS